MGSERWGQWQDTQRPSLPRACSGCCSSAPWWHFGCLLGTSDHRDRWGCPACDWWGQEGQWCPVPCPGVWGGAVAGAGLAARAGSSCSHPLCELSSSSPIFCCSGNTPKLYCTSCRWLKGELKLQEEMWSIQKGRFSSFSLRSLQLNYFKLINVSFYPKQKSSEHLHRQVRAWSAAISTPILCPVAHRWQSPEQMGKSQRADVHEQLCIWDVPRLTLGWAYPWWHVHQNLFLLHLALPEFCSYGID